MIGVGRPGVLRVRCRDAQPVWLRAFGGVDRVPNRTWIRMSANTPSGDHREVGAGKPSPSAARPPLDTSRHPYPNPSVGVRGMLHHIVASLGQVPSLYTAALAPQAVDALAAEHEAIEIIGCRR